MGVPRHGLQRLYGSDRLGLPARPVPAGLQARRQWLQSPDRHAHHWAPLPEAFTAPFYEFDATAQYRPGPHGSGGYAIWLHHRYTTMEVCLGAKLHSLDFSLNEAMAFWDTLQRYMDVTQPLPDLPILEQFRHLDPTTATHDREYRRNPRHWRDMNHADWESHGRGEMMQRTRDHKWQTRPCILQARIDPTSPSKPITAARKPRAFRPHPRPRISPSADADLGTQPEHPPTRPCSLGRCSRLGPGAPALMHISHYGI